MKVFVTGMGVISPLGNSADELFQALLENRSAVRYYPEWKNLNGLQSHLGAPAMPFDSKSIPRAIRRSMSRMSEMALLATQDALSMCSMNLGDESIDCERVFLNIGSTTGSPETLESFYKKLSIGGMQGQFATDFFKIMNHSVAANVASGLGFCGPLLASSSACSTSTQSIVNGYEMVKSGLYDVAIVGGADELHYTSAGIFDLVNAATRGFNHDPDKASRPFDKDRDGLVVAEGAAIFVIESEEHLKKRNAKKIVEILGGAYLCDGTHMSQPQIKSMVKAMKMALKRANLATHEIDYINAHATSTVMGDIEESHAIYELFGGDLPVSSLKGHMGHTLAACGGIETVATVKMMERGILIPNRNLFEVDPRCSRINLLKENGYTKIKTSLINNFAFGGMSASLVIGAIQE